SEDEFDIAELCFSSNVETNMFDEILNVNRQLQMAEETIGLPGSKTEIDKFIDLEEELYPLTK
ncbi:24229_t:CDS:1, partial [Racocetra persica]